MLLPCIQNQSILDRKKDSGEISESFIFLDFMRVLKKSFYAESQRNMLWYEF